MSRTLKEVIVMRSRHGVKALDEIAECVSGIKYSAAPTDPLWFSRLSGHSDTVYFLIRRIFTQFEEGVLRLHWPLTDCAICINWTTKSDFLGVCTI